MKKSGFTLVEFLIVVAMLGVLAALAIPAFIGYTHRGLVQQRLARQVGSVPIVVIAASDTDVQVRNPEGVVDDGGDDPPGTFRRPYGSICRVHLGSKTIIVGQDPEQDVILFRTATVLTRRNPLSEECPIGTAFFLSMEKTYEWMQYTDGGGASVEQGSDDPLKDSARRLLERDRAAHQ